MKKIFLLLCVALLLTACADAPVETTDAVTVAVPATQTTEVAETTAPATKEWTAQAKAAHGAIIADIKQENALIGVAYLGYFEGTESDVAKHLEDLGVKEKYLFALSRSPSPRVLATRAVPPLPIINPIPPSIIISEMERLFINPTEGPSAPP